jgi:membrane dipeptidase
MLANLQNQQPEFRGDTMVVRAVFVVLLAFAGTQVAAGSPPAQADLEHARRVLAGAILFDGNNDLPWAIRTDKKTPGDIVGYDLRKPTAGQTDLPRLRQGGVGAQFWSVYIPGELKTGFARMQLEQIDIMRRVIERYPDSFQLARTAKDIRDAKKAGRIGSMLGMEGGHAIENSLGALRAYYDLGVRYMTLTHNVTTDWADSAADEPRHHGLTPFGEQVVLEMNRIGMLVDLSHTSAETMEDAIRVSRAPVIFSHSSARAICDVPRNVPDDILKKMPANGGVVMVTFVPGFTDPDVARVMQPALEDYNRRARELKTEAERDALFDELIGNLKLPKTTIAKVADQIDYVRRMAGVEHVGIGADFDGNSQWPEGLSDVSTYPNLFAELIHRGWTDKDLKLLAGENVLRALEQAERVAAKMKSEVPAPPVGSENVSAQ